MTLPSTNTTPETKIKLRPTRPQFDFLLAQEKFPAFVAGMGSGKTEALVVRSIVNKLLWPDCDRGFYAPTYDLIRLIAWPRYEDILSRLGLRYKLTKYPTPMIEIPHYGTIYFRSMETPSRIIGYEHADADVDEIDTLPLKQAQEVWRRIISRNRQKKLNPRPQKDFPLQPNPRNTIAIATTPEGFRFTYKNWKEKPFKDSRIIPASTYSNLANLPDDYIETMQDQYPANLFQAYVQGEFVNLAQGTVYYAFNRERHDTSIVENGSEPLHIGVDFNVGKMAAVVHVIRSSKRLGDFPVAVDEFFGAADTPGLIRQIQARYPDRQVTVYPDATGKGRKSTDASKTDLSLLKDAGFRVIVNRANPPVRDRINAMNGALEHKGYLVNCSRCPIYTGCLEQQAYNEQGEPDKKQDLDHHPDAAGYYIVKVWGIEKPVYETSIGMVI